MILILYFTLQVSEKIRVDVHHDDCAFGDSDMRNCEGPVKQEEVKRRRAQNAEKHRSCTLI
jgi:hypothetical protein